MTTRIDITGLLSPEMWSYKPSVPDVPPFEQRRWATVEERGWEADWFAMPTLAGTYLETAKHLFPEELSIDEVPVERLFLRAVVANIPKGAREHIGVEDLEAAAVAVQPGDALLVRTGWSDAGWLDDGSTFVMESPHFDLAGMKWIVDRGVSILGGDMPCFDDPQPGQGMDVNVHLFQSGALILAPLCNLPVTDDPVWTLTVLPIPLQGACGAPCRAVLSRD